MDDRSSSYESCYCVCHTTDPADSRHLQCILPHLTLHYTTSDHIAQISSGLSGVLGKLSPKQSSQVARSPSDQCRRLRPVVLPLAESLVLHKLDITGALTIVFQLEALELLACIIPLRWSFSRDFIFR